MKRIIIFCVITQLLTLKILNASHNFYIGANINLGTLSGKRNDSATNITPVTTILANNKSTHAQSAYAGIFTGYLFRVQNFGIGPEFFYNYGKLENKIDGTHSDAVQGIDTKFEITNKISSQMGANIRLGYFYQDYFFYGLLGALYQKIQFSALATRFDAGLGGPPASYNYKPAKKRASTFIFGFGAQKAINEKYIVGLEFKIADLPKKTYTWKLHDPTNTSLNSSFKYQLRSIGLKLMYIF